MQLVWRKRNKHKTLWLEILLISHLGGQGVSDRKLRKWILGKYAANIQDERWTQVV
jgi:hypothetical protein